LIDGFFSLGYTSLFQYVVQSLELSESVAANFITVSRKAKEFPALQSAINEGKITVSKARKVTAVLTSENQEEWVNKAVELPQKKLEEQVASIAPETKIREGVKPVTGKPLSIKNRNLQRAWGETKTSSGFGVPENSPSG
jgi:hypothetical protein